MGNNKYGIMRTYSLRKFFITQLTNHGVEDKIITFFICHKIPEIDSFIKDDDLKKIVKNIIHKELKSESISNKFGSKIVTTEKEIVELSNQGYDCQQIGKNKWLMRKKLDRFYGVVK